MICTIAKHRGRGKGYADALMLEWQGSVGRRHPAPNVVFVREGKIHPPTGRLLSSTD